MGQYVTAAEIKKRCAGKIYFADTDDDDNAVGPTLLDEIIAEAEAQVETRLSVRYAIPFVHKSGSAFSTLSTNTQTVIKSLVRSESVRRLLDTDFGRGTAVEGAKYARQQYEVFEMQANRLVERREGTFGQFLYPPLVDLALAPHNSEADDGYAGRIYLTSDEPGDFASRQMPDPGESFWNGEIPET